MILRAGSRITSGACILLLVVVLELATARQLSPNVSATVFGDDEPQFPLVLLRAGSSSGDGALPPAELGIFAEDPSWAFKVEEFMVEKGADTEAVEISLNNIRESSWAAGKTFRRKHLVLLAFAEDVQPDGKECASSRLTRAVLAASKHTTGAHFVLVANGFTLDAMTRRSVNGVLADSGWRCFTAIEVPEFEGFSSAVNRAMKVIPDNSLVAMLSTSDLLLPSSTDYTSSPATLNMDARNVAGGASTNIGGGRTPSDVFVGYERMQYTASFPTSSTAGSTPSRSLESREEATAIHQPLQDNSHGDAVEWQAWYDHYGRVHRRRSIDEIETLLVTASTSDLDAESTSVDGDTTSPLEQIGGEESPSMNRKEEENAGDVHEEAETTAREYATTGRRPPTAKRRQAPAARLSNAAPFPLLVFDTQTFLALGELDERFAFQGGIADWISRAKLKRSNHGVGIDPDVAGRCCDASPYRHRTTPRKRRAAADRRTVTLSRCSDGSVPHVHDSSWSKNFVRPWPDSDFRLRCPTSEEDDRPDGGVRNSEIREQAFRSQADDDRFGERQGVSNARTSEDIILDQWTRLSLAKLEGMVQADADLFFLPLLMLLSPRSDAPHEELFPVEPCVAFHSEWMERVPDHRMLEKAVIRRRAFPVAVVVVAHDDVSLLRPALEEVAVVVEHILVVVSLTPWHGAATDVSPTLELLDKLLEDMDSPTYGKLRVEVGSWHTEPDQREYGNAVIRDDPREFRRVVAMDPDEFWHPVELARALVLAAEHPERRHFRAQVDPYWANVRSVVFPPEVMNAVWLIDPRRCIWREFRQVLCDAEVDEHDALIDRSAGVIRHLSYHEERHDLEQLQIRPVCGNLAVVDVSERGNVPGPLWAEARYGGKMDSSLFLSTLHGGDAVWSNLLEATSSRDQCANPPCGRGKHVHAPWADLAEEMSRVEGAVVVRRPDLAKAHGMLAPDVNINYTKTLQSYMEIFNRFLFPGRTMIAGHHLAEVRKNRRFIDAVLGEDSAAARYLGTFPLDFEDPPKARYGYEHTPSLVGMADVFINNLGYVWNKKDYIVPTSCDAELFGPRVRTSLPTTTKSYEKVFVMAQRWGDEYFHFFVEALPRITLALDILREHLDIKIALYAPQPATKDYKTYMAQFLELLGLRADRLIFIQEPIHADLAILSSSAPCFKPDAQTINMLRHVLLQALHPDTGGVPLPPSRPVLVLVVRKSLRWLRNNDQVRNALQQEFPGYDVVEFFGVGSIVSQLRLFSTASLVVAPHGAGLSNIMVSPRHTPVLEIAPPACTACYVHLALKLQHIYARHSGSSTWTTRCESEYEPDVDEIVILVRHLLEAKLRADGADPESAAVVNV